MFLTLPEIELQPCKLCGKSTPYSFCPDCDEYFKVFEQYYQTQEQLKAK